MAVLMTCACEVRVCTQSVVENFADPTPPQLLLGKGTALATVLTYRAELGGGPPAAVWHRQLARDANFNDLVIDAKVDTKADTKEAAEALRWPIEALPAGELYARISAIDADRFEGQASAVLHFQVALLQLVPATNTELAGVVFPRGLLCALDGAALTAAERAALSPAREHQVRCALKSHPQRVVPAELTVSAIESGADPKASEPAPEKLIYLAPPRLQPVPPPPKEQRVYFDLAAAGSFLFTKEVYGFGGGVELGPRIRLPFGSLRLALRVLAEQRSAPESPPVMVNLGGVVTYVLGRPSWRVSPYFGVWAQGMLQRTATRLAPGAVRNNTGLVLGGLAGAQLRLGRGGLFAELGYRNTLIEQLPVQAPEWNTGFLLLGYRLSL